MSYILDALRKADAERERGTVPGIHAQPMFAGAAPPAGARRGVPPWVWVAVTLLALVLVAVLSWALLAGRSAPAAATEPAPAPLASTRPSPASAPMTAAAPATTTVPASSLPAAPVPAPATPVAPAVPALPVARKPATPAATKPAPAETRAAAAPAAPASVKPSAASAAEDRVLTLNELPDDVRRQLPAVNVGGSMYSANKADRLLIINGQVLHEGDAVAPGLVLEQIKLKAAVLAFKGYRYGIAF